MRPQSVLLTFFGDYLNEPEVSVASASVIELLDAAGVSEHAARATLTRMVNRGLLDRVPVGRQVYFGLTDFGRSTVTEGRERAHAVDGRGEEWDGRWTFVAYSLPEEAQRERYELRATLTWAGFGMLQAGLWAAPRSVDVASLVSGREVLGRTYVLRGVPEPPSTDTELVAQAYDLSELAEAYSAFIRRWTPLAAHDLNRLDDPLIARVVLATDWLQVIRGDPRLPRALAADDWPGEPARALYLDLDRRLEPLAKAEARSRLMIVTPRRPDATDPSTRRPPRPERAQRA